MSHPCFAGVTDPIGTGQLWRDRGLPPLNPSHDRGMIRSVPAMLAEVRGLLDARGFRI